MTKKKLIKNYDKIASGWTALKNIVNMLDSDLTKEERQELDKLLKEMEVPLGKFKEYLSQKK